MEYSHSAFREILEIYLEIFLEIFGDFFGDFGDFFVTFLSANYLDKQHACSVAMYYHVMALLKYFK